MIGRARSLAALGAALALAGCWGGGDDRDTYVVRDRAPQVVYAYDDDDYRRGSGLGDLATGVALGALLSDAGRRDDVRVVERPTIRESRPRRTTKPRPPPVRAKEASRQNRAANAARASYRSITKSRTKRAATRTKRRR